MGNCCNDAKTSEFKSELIPQRQESAKNYMLKNFDDECYSPKKDNELEADEQYLEGKTTRSDQENLKENQILNKEIIKINSKIAHQCKLKA